MAKKKSYVISGTAGGPGVDNTSEVVLEADDAGNPTKVIGVDQPCDLTDKNKETLDSLGITVAESELSADDVQVLQAPASDTAAAAPQFS